MLGYAVLDARDDDDQIAVWLTSRVGPTAVEHTNAVQLRRGDTRQLRALVAGRVVVLTSGTSLASAPAVPDAVGVMSFADLDVFVTATREQHARVVDAIRAYMARTRNRSLVLPEPPPVRALAVLPGEATATDRALAGADYVRWVWRDWLEVEDQRSRRSVSPRTGESPWIMPPDLSSVTICELPPALVDRFVPASAA